MLEDGLSYPFEGDSAVGRIVIGGLLGFASVLIVPAFALMGYLVWVLGGAARGETEPPAFENWGEMIVDGLKATAVSIVYGIVPFLLVFLSIFVVAGGASAGDSAGGILGGLGVIGILVSLLAMFVLYYLIPAALTNMAIEDEFAAAFDFGTIKQAVFSVDYLIAWLIPFVLAAVVNVVVVLLAFTIVGLVVVPFLQFYVQVAAFYMFGTAFRKAVDVDGGADAEPTPTI